MSTVKPAPPFGLSRARTMAVQMRAARKYQAMQGQLCAYFDLLVRLAERTDDESARRDLLARIERTMAEMSRRDIARVR